MPGTQREQPDILSEEQTGKMFMRLTMKEESRLALRSFNKLMN